MKKGALVIGALWVVLTHAAAQGVGYTTDPWGMPDLDLSVVRDEVNTVPTPVARPSLNTVAMEDSATWVGRLQRTLDTLCMSSLFESSQLGM